MRNTSSTSFTTCEVQAAASVREGIIVINKAILQLEVPHVFTLVGIRQKGEGEREVGSVQGEKENWAGATGMVSTVIAIPVFEGKKWRCWDSDFHARSYIQSFPLQSSLRLPLYKTMRKGTTFSVFTPDLISSLVDIQGLGTTSTLPEWRQD